MLILLPPSEGKAQPEKGKKLNLSQLLFASDLTEIRESVMPASVDITKSRPAHEIYTGVLYQSLGWSTLSQAAQNRGEKSIVIISAVFGVLRITDVIPTYKAKIKAALWQKAITPLLDEKNDDLIIDCRSSTYSTVWKPDPKKTVAVRVFQIKNGKRLVITHMSKKYRGELTRLLLKQGTSPATPHKVKEIASKEFACEFHKSDGKLPAYLDLLIDLG